MHPSEGSRGRRAPHRARRGVRSSLIRPTPTPTQAAAEDRWPHPVPAAPARARRSDERATPQDATARGVQHAPVRHLRRPRHDPVAELHVVRCLSAPPGHERPSPRAPAARPGRP
jgi:hypothetical protein